jgi:two-component system response regulator
VTNVVLLVEDNPTDEKLSLRALRRGDPAPDIVVARDGVEALDYLFGTGEHAGRDVAELPAVVLLDLRLPRIEGIEVLRRIRADERTATLPVVVLTSSMQADDISRAYALGVNAYVRKPVDFMEFVEMSRVLVKFWLTLNERPR